MNASSPLLTRTLLALALLLGSAASLPAQPTDNPPTIRATATGRSPVVAGFLSFRSGTSRSWVVRIACLGMVLALFIIMRGSSRY